MLRRIAHRFFTLQTIFTIWLGMHGAGQLCMGATLTRIPVAYKHPQVTIDIKHQWRDSFISRWVVGWMVWPPIRRG